MPLKILHKENNKDEDSRVYKNFNSIMSTISLGIVSFLTGGVIANGFSISKTNNLLEDIDSSLDNIQDILDIRDR